VAFILGRGTASRIANAAADCRASSGTQVGLLARFLRQDGCAKRVSWVFWGLQALSVPCSGSTDAPSFHACWKESRTRTSGRSMVPL
jgi:hypothetical protein